jgi:protein O-GlcNAc transferase
MLPVAPMPDAVSALNRLASSPTSVEAAFELGLVLHPGWLARVLALAPDHAGAAVNLAVALGNAGGRADEAERWHRRTLALDPLAVDALAGLGAVARARQRSGLAWDRRALALRPDHAPILANVSHGIFAFGDAARALAWARRAEAVDPADPSFGRAALGLMQYLSWPDPAVVLERHRRWASRHARPGPRPRRRHGARRLLRVGYVSVSLRRHPVGIFLLPLLEAHDPKEVTAIGYAAGTIVDETTDRLRRATAGWRVIARLDDGAAAELIRADDLDVLVDLDGQTSGGRLSLFARRPAPVQVTWLDYPATTGCAAFDAALVDPYEVPAGAEAWYAEPVVRLPGGRLVYRPPETCPEVSIGGADGLRFGCFNDPAKTGPETVALWAKILHAVPEARLALKGRSYADPAIRARALDAFAACGIEAGRLLLSDWSPHEAMLRELSEIDVALDPTPFSGYLTSCEALWMGVPVVTLAGRRAVERQTGGLLARVGLGELIAGTPEDYVAIAVGLARDPDRRRELRAGMRARLRASSLMDEAGFARSVEAAYRRLWEAAP